MPGLNGVVLRALDSARSAESAHNYAEALREYEIIDAQSGTVEAELVQIVPPGSSGDAPMSLSQRMARMNADSLLNTVTLAQRQIGVYYETAGPGNKITQRRCIGIKKPSTP